MSLRKCKISNKEHELVVSANQRASLLDEQQYTPKEHVTQYEQRVFFLLFKLTEYRNLDHCFSTDIHINGNISNVNT